MTCLHHAAMRGNVEIVEHLVNNYGPDLSNMKDIQVRFIILYPAFSFVLLSQSPFLSIQLSSSFFSLYVILSQRLSCSTSFSLYFSISFSLCLSIYLSQFLFCLISLSFSFNHSFSVSFFSPSLSPFVRY